MPSSQFWSNRWVVVVIGDKRVSAGQSSPRGQLWGRNGLILSALGQ